MARGKNCARYLYRKLRVSSDRRTCRLNMKVNIQNCEKLFQYLNSMQGLSICMGSYEHFIHNSVLGVMLKNFLTSRVMIFLLAKPNDKTNQHLVFPGFLLLTFSSYIALYKSSSKDCLFVFLRRFTKPAIPNYDKGPPMLCCLYRIVTSLDIA